MTKEKRALSPERLEAARRGGLKGGAVTAQIEGHFQRIGRLSGLQVSQDREHMAEIGRRGGLKSAETRRKKREEKEQCKTTSATA